MGKSLRAKKEQKNKAAKRDGVFGEVYNQRLERLAEKLKEHAAKQVAESDKKEETTESMEVDTPKKISTAGWKNKKKHGNGRKRTRHRN